MTFHEDVRRGLRKTALILLLLLNIPIGAMAGGWQLPQLPAAESYGNILMDSVSSANGAKPVAFSHWIHRRKFTCRVCHSELGFFMEKGGTEITETANREGSFCGACHNGKTSFALEGNCNRCHGGSTQPSPQRTSEFESLPKAAYGYGVDWVMAMQDKRITPADFLSISSHPVILDKTLTIEAGWNFISPSIFPHRPHSEQLDCNSCHPDIFNIQKKGTKDFNMESMLGGDFCGVCHRNVAFPLHDCKRCHPGFTEW